MIAVRIYRLSVRCVHRSRLAGRFQIGVAVAISLAIVLQTFPLLAVAANEADPVADAVTEAAQRFAVPEARIRQVIHAESAGEPLAMSVKGAMGMMQIMPQTYADLRRQYGLGEDPYSIHDNILAGTAYLRLLLDRYGESGFLAAYNAGPARYDDYLTGGRPLPQETLRYLHEFGMDGRGDLFVGAPAVGRTVFVSSGLTLATDGSRPSSKMFVPVKDVGP